MASTYKLISSVTVGSGGTSTIAFTSIPNTYTHLLFRLSIRCLAGGIDEQLRVNFNDTGVGNTTLNKVLQGNGLGSVGSANSSTWIIGGFNGNGATANTFTDAEIFIPNYLSSLNKNFYVDSAMETNAAQCYTEITAGVWENTAAITSVAFLTPSVNFAQYSTAYLYGIEIPANQITPKATGGDITYDNNYVYHTFRQSGTFTPSQNLTADYLVVAGGGGGGYSDGGGGGAGGLRSTVTATGGGGSLESALSLTSGTGYTVTVGAGGAGRSSNGAGTSGSNSVFSTITSTGGGGGGGGSTNDGLTGGSGGGGANGNGGAGTANQGYAGGTSSGGGGGAGAAGSNNGAGGNGVATSISGTSITYAGGGAGGTGGGGSGGGGASSTNGTANTGGGGGRWNGTGSSGSGGSGVVIVRYAR